jgi:hypothetical protein
MKTPMYIWNQEKNFQQFAAWSDIPQELQDKI